MHTLDILKSHCENCTDCPLCETRHNIVFGTGNPYSKIMFIGEAPGEKEDLTALPFVGRGGILLDELIAEIGLYRDKNIYIANSVKCRPPKNRDPSTSEQKTCLHWLEKQIEIIDPKIIVCVGRISAMRFIKKDIKIMKEHGQFFEKDGRLYMPVLHPAAILRNINNKPLAREDFKLLENKINELELLFNI
ncbi:MAG: uracil-DNA glycosylase [Clostridia bacterium]